MADPGSCDEPVDTTESLTAVLRSAGWIPHGSAVSSIVREQAGGGGALGRVDRLTVGYGPDGEHVLTLIAKQARPSVPQSAAMFDHEVRVNGSGIFAAAGVALPRHLVVTEGPLAPALLLQDLGDSGFIRFETVAPVVADARRVRGDPRRRGGVPALRRSDDDRARRLPQPEPSPSRDGRADRVTVVDLQLVQARPRAPRPLPRAADAAGGRRPPLRADAAHPPAVRAAVGDDLPLEREACAAMDDWGCLDLRL